MEEALSLVEDLDPEIVTPTVTATGHAGKAAGELWTADENDVSESSASGWKCNQEKQQKWMEMMQEKQHDVVDSKLKLPRPMLQKLTADDDIYKLSAKV